MRRDRDVIFPIAHNDKAQDNSGWFAIAKELIVAPVMTHALSWKGIFKHSEPLRLSAIETHSDTAAFDPGFLGIQSRGQSDTVFKLQRFQTKINTSRIGFLG